MSGFRLLLLLVASFPGAGRSNGVSSIPGPLRYDILGIKGRGVPALVLQPFAYYPRPAGVVAISRAGVVEGGGRVKVLLEECGISLRTRPLATPLHKAHTHTI